MFITVLRAYGRYVPEPKKVPQRSRDINDNYLLGICDAADVHVLITGDKDLLTLGTHGRTRILTACSFRREYVG